MLLQEMLQDSTLLLPRTPSAPAAQAVEGLPLSGQIVTVVFVLLAILFLHRFLQLVPLLVDSFFRARGSSTLENSVRFSHDRNLQALILAIPAVVIMYRYRLYDPSFVQELAPDARLLAICGVWAVYLALRQFFYWCFRPHRRQDFYRLAYYASCSYFILLMIIVLLTVGIISALGGSDLTMRWFLYTETIVIYAYYLFRKTQILSLFCTPFRIFLYLCGLEFLPTAILVVSATF